MDAQPLCALPGLPRPRWRARRIQRQVHGQPDGAAWRLAGDAGGTHARHLSQLLLSAAALAVHGAAPFRLSDIGRVMPVLARVAPVPEPSNAAAAFATDVLAGLKAEPKTLPAKYFYDSTGSRLFERITELPEYYLTRTELGLLEERATDIGRLLPEKAALIEFGSGASTKAAILLRAAPHVAAYVPVDISADILHREADVLRRSFPKLAVVPVYADFCKRFDVPAAVSELPRAGFFPGSTIGNFEPHEACTFLRNAGRILRPGSRFIIGVDLVKDRAVLHAAYNDAAGITAKFNLNILARINRELGANFNLRY